MNGSRVSDRTSESFTLIELLIVVAIIAILAAIAVPNFLEAQVRSKVSRVESDHRTLGLGLESYAVDHGKYPPCYYWPHDGGPVQPPIVAYSRLTTPVAFITDVFMDPFQKGNPPDLLPLFVGTYWYIEKVSYSEDDQAGPASWLALIGNDSEAERVRWLVTSTGPDGRWNYQDNPPGGVDPTLYDSSNGVVSRGDIGRRGP